jgi:hypothetical protein
MTERWDSPALIALSTIESIRLQKSHATSDRFGRPGWAPWVSALVNTHVEQALNANATVGRLAAPPLGMDRDVQREAYYVSMVAATRALWSRYRVVYAIDPDLWEELGNTSDDQLVPAGLMTQLPHPDPFVALPVAMRIPMKDDMYALARGFFVNGRIRLPTETGFVGCSTSAPVASGALGLSIVATVHNADGSHVLTGGGQHDLLWNHVTLDTDGGDRLTGDLVATVLERFDFSADAGVAPEDVATVIRACIGTLIYLCATNADLKPLAPAGRLAARLVGAKKIPRVIQVGSVVGAQLRASRLSTGNPGVGTHRSPRPHLRRAHFHTYRVGEGREGVKVRWVAWTGVGMSKDESAATTTVVKVARQKQEARDA